MNEIEIFEKDVLQNLTFHPERTQHSWKHVDRRLSIPWSCDKCTLFIIYQASGACGKTLELPIEQNSGGKKQIKLKLWRLVLYFCAILSLVCFMWRKFGEDVLLKIKQFPRCCNMFYDFQMQSKVHKANYRTEIVSDYVRNERFK